MNFLFLMDPLETVKVDKDTTFALMLGAHRKGHGVYYLPKHGISLNDNKLFFDVGKVVPQRNATPPFLVQKQCRISEDQVHAVFIRTDPPFDYEYLVHTWLLDRLEERVPVINKPSGIRTVNEKIWATRFTSIVPPTLVTRQRAHMQEFLEERNAIVVKPTDRYGGQSVFLVRKGDPNTNVIFETVSRNFTQDVILQTFVPEADQGDKRILLLNGEPLAAVLRIHAPGEHRNNFFAGGKPVIAQLTARDHEIIGILKPDLKKLGLYFAGIDIVGEFLIEVNVTSPTGLQEMNRFNQAQYEDDVIAFVEGLVKERSR